MSKADKMFENLGYRKEEDERQIDYIGYFEGYKRHIWFFKPFQNYSINDYSSLPYVSVDTFKNEEERDAVMTKIKELGWLDE